MQKSHAALLLAALPLVVLAQEPKPVPEDSVRVSVSGCAKNYIFTASEPTEDRRGGSAIAAGTRLRMNGPKKVMGELKGTEGSRVEITGLMKKGQIGPEGVDLGRGVRVRPGIGGPSAGLGGSIGVGSPAGYQIMIDVEGWRRVPGECSR